ncbi:uncharacterized protein LOC108250809 [Kryptolebias marmoratus]|uniref:Uncharacterized LOC108250809 n=1 Tax=Kryptolebias marmoratus TaxID=37003 RepID=A0A3Q3B3E9_KRYMA|nr:uncharacterized protein LOC108250809 [Kryptolebias marmoratus]XP_037834703.1 uncharacterized protein LOC108250809 [Kryptolebias marmoratus]
MASVGPVLLLLLMSSLFLLSNQQKPPTSKNEKIKQAVKTGTDVLVKIEPFIFLIPEAGKYLSAFIKVIKAFQGDGDETLNALNSEFKNLNEKLENQLITMTWHTWASGPFQEAELNIRSSWKNLNELVEACKGSCPKQQYEDLFNKLHTNLVFSPDKLHMLLTTQQPSFISDFKTLFTDQFRCHESSIDDFTKLLDELMFRGNTLSLFYYSLHGVNKADELTQRTYETFSVMTDIHRYCISNPDKYIQKDVIDLIDENQDRQQLAKDVMEFLEKTYQRYDWLVVAFITKHSKHSHWYSRFLNKHFLSGFLEVTKGEVSVAVAKQMKGNHQMVGTVQQLIKKCLGENVKCEKVIEKLTNCGEENRPLPDYYTAVHVFRSASHDSAEAEEYEFTDEEEQSEPAYIYTGKCKKEIKDGHFRVLIRSDEDLKREDPCKDVNCGGAQRGECVTLENIWKAVCKCKPGYYGPKCEISSQDLKQALEKGTIKFKN